eukprot:249848-Karenia_brevis.AAC.1
MLYAYTYTLCRRAVVATFDLSAQNLDLLQSDHWLSNPRNVLVVRLDAPAWVRVPGDAEHVADSEDFLPPRTQVAKM